jgi:ABC-2 type transport system ATP-binding protein
LLGANGAGKTTLLQILAGLIPSDSCEIKTKDTDRELFYYIPNKPNFLEYLSGRENLEMLSSLKGINKQEVNDLIDKFDVSNFIDELFITYSQGMAEQLSFLMGFLFNPHILLLDEPFSSLDILNSIKIKNKLKQYISGGNSTIISTHIMAVAHQLSDEVLLLNNREIIQFQNNFHDLQEFEKVVLDFLKRPEQS